MLLKNKLINDIALNIIKNYIQTHVFNILIDKILPYASLLFNYLNTCSYFYIFIYLILAVVLIFIIYKIIKYFNHKRLSSVKISSILSDSSDFNLDPKKMEKKKYRNTSKKILTTDLLTSS